MGNVGLWDVSNGSRIATLPGGTSPVAFSVDGSTLTSGAEANDGTGRQFVLWDVQSRSRVSTVDADELGFTSAISPDGRTFAADNVTETQLLDVYQGMRLAALPAMDFTFQLFFQRGRKDSRCGRSTWHDRPLGCSQSDRDHHAHRAQQRSEQPRL